MTFRIGYIAILATVVTVMLAACSNGTTTQDESRQYARANLAARHSDFRFRLILRSPQPRPYRAPRRRPRRPSRLRFRRPRPFRFRQPFQPPRQSQPRSRTLQPRLRPKVQPRIRRRCIWRPLRPLRPARHHRQFPPLYRLPIHPRPFQPRRKSRLPQPSRQRPGFQIRLRQPRPATRVPNTPTPVPTPVPQQTAAEYGTNVGDLAHLFTLPSIDGQEYSLDDFPGQDDRSCVLPGILVTVLPETTR